MLTGTVSRCMTGRPPPGESGPRPCKAWTWRLCPPGNAPGRMGPEPETTETWTLLTEVRTGPRVCPTGGRPHAAAVSGASREAAPEQRVWGGADFMPSESQVRLLTGYHRNQLLWTVWRSACGSGSVLCLQGACPRGTTAATVHLGALGEAAGVRDLDWAPGEEARPPGDHREEASEGGSLTVPAVRCPPSSGSEQTRDQKRCRGLRLVPARLCSF